MKTIFILNRPGGGAATRPTAPTGGAITRGFGRRAGQLAGRARGLSGRILPKDNGTGTN